MDGGGGEGMIIEDLVDGSGESEVEVNVVLADQVFAD